MVDFDTIVARIYVPEGELVRLRLGQQARLFSDSLEADRIGEVERIAPVVDPRSGTVKVTVAIPGNQGLLPGMYVEVELVTEVLEEALLVPKRAVIYSDTQAFLYRYREETQKVERVTLEVRLEDRQNLVPASDVLATGDQLVVAGQAGLKDGVKVRPVAAVPSAAEGTGGMP
jgi:membrane fusion protein (multidrug efflux system)